MNAMVKYLQERPDNLCQAAEEFKMDVKSFATALKGYHTFSYDNWSGHLFIPREGEEASQARRRLRKKFGKDFALADTGRIQYTGQRTFK